MQLHSSGRTGLLSFVASIGMLTIGGLAAADPPSRVARLGHVSGEVSFSPGGEDDWVQASINRPLTTGDRLWSDNDSRAELQVGGAIVRMSQQTGIAILDLDDQNTQVQLTQGRLNVRVRRLDRDQVIEIDTPNLAFTVREPGDYRIEVEPDGGSTTIAVRRGQGEAYGEGAAYVLDMQQTYRFYGSDLSDYEYVDAPRFDDFDRWCSDRDRRYDNSVSARYVSPDVVGYQDLDEYGSWRRDSTYGDVWYPNRVNAGWAPYSSGHWAWIDPWGWTWVDNAPWGFTVSHYGRWANLQGNWFWIPGPMQTRAYYAPALVVFVGGNNLQLSSSSGRVGSVAWFPLGPREVYRPSYQVSRGYFDNINRSNTVVNTTVINNYYYDNSRVQNVVYVNRQIPGAVVAVPRTAFVQSQQVSRDAVQVQRDSAIAGPVDFAASVAPTKSSVRGAGVVRNRPPARVFERPVVARTTPPPAPVGFAAQEQQLASQPGKPLDDEARKHVKREAAAPAPVVKVVAPTVAAAPTTRPPPSSPKSGQHGKSNQNERPDQRGQPVAPPVTRSTPTPPVTQAAPAASNAKPVERTEQSQQVASPPKQHGKSERHGPDQDGQPVSIPPTVGSSPMPAPAQAVPPTPPMPPADAAAAPAAQPGAAPDTQKGKGKKKKDVEEPVTPPAPEDSTPPG